MAPNYHGINLVKGYWCSCIIFTHQNVTVNKKACMHYYSCVARDAAANSIYYWEVLTLPTMALGVSLLAIRIERGS